MKTVQPALIPLSSMAYGLTRALAKRNRNVPIQEFRIGLDFAHRPFGACLREGAYLAVQVPAGVASTWDWADWAYAPNTAEIVSVDGNAASLPYNYIVFTISRYEEGD